MKRLIFFLGLLLWSICGAAQKTVVSGTVTDAKTGEGISQASVTADGGKVTVVTNEDGFFTLNFIRKCRVSETGLLLNHIR